MHMVKTPDWPSDRFKALIDRILDETGLNKAQLAALLGINPSQVSRWTNGSTRPKFDNLVGLGESLKRRFPAINVGAAELLAAAGYSAVRDSEESSTAKPDLTALPPDLADITDPTPAEAAMLAILAATRREIETLREEVKEIRDEQGRDSRDRKGA